MQTDLRVLLFIIAIVCVAYIFFRIVRSRRQNALLSQPSASLSTAFSTETFEEVILENKQIDPLLEQVPEQPQPAEGVDKPPAEPKESYIALSLVPKERAFPGHLLLSVLRSHHFHLSQQKVFCRHVNEDPTQPALFSVLSIREPGTFEFSHMPQETFSGILILMVLSSVEDPAQAFEKMLISARQLAASLNAEVCNGQRRPLTVEALIDYRNRVLKWA